MNSLEILAYILIPLIFLGIFGNINIIVATLLNKKLRNIGGKLVAIAAGLDLISCLGETLNVTLILSNKSKMCRETCFRIIAIYLYSMNSCIIVLLGIAFQRVAAVCCPVWYHKVQDELYTIVLMCVASIYSLVYIIANIFVMENAIIEPCNPVLALVPNVKTIWACISLSIIAVIIGLNCVLIFALHCRNRKEPDAYRKKQARLTQTAITVTAICSVLMLTPGIIASVTRLLTISPFLKERIIAYLVLFSAGRFACNYYLLLWRNPTYRHVFLQQLGFHSKSSTTCIAVAEARSGIMHTTVKKKPTLSAPWNRVKPSI